MLGTFRTTLALFHALFILTGVVYGQDSNELVSSQPTVCSLPADIGPCRQSMRKFYYDGPSGECKEFIYGGCRGNGNRFETEDECLDTCGAEFVNSLENRDDEDGISTEVAVSVNNNASLNQSEIEVDLCLLPPQVGWCKASLLRYFYNSTSEQCEIFYYGGCKGNLNRFETVGECEQRCSQNGTFKTRTMEKRKDDGDVGTLIIRHDDLENKTLDFETESMVGWTMDNMSLLIVDPTEEGTFGVFNAGELEIPHSKSLGYYIAVIDSNETSTLRRNISIPEGSLLTVSFSFYIWDMSNSTDGPGANFTLTFGKYGDSNYSDLVLFDLSSQPVENDVWKHFKFEITNKKEMLDMELVFAGAVYDEANVVIGLDNIGLEWMEVVNSVEEVDSVEDVSTENTSITSEGKQPGNDDDDGPYEVVIDVLKGFNASLAYRNKFHIVNSTNITISLNF